MRIICRTYGTRLDLALRPEVQRARRPFPYALALTAFFAGISALSFWFSYAW